jgi:autotransporter-associated beta strand protein
MRQLYSFTYGKIPRAALQGEEAFHFAKKENCMKKILLPVKALAIIMILIANLFFVNAVFGQNNVWDGSSSTEWGTAANWSLNRVPLSTDDVVIGNFVPGDQPTLSVSTTINSLTINGRSNSSNRRGGELTIATGITLTITNNLTINGSSGGGTGIASLGITASGSASVIVGGNVLTVNNTGGPPEDAHLIFGSGSLTISGNFTLGTFSTFTSGTGTVIFNKSSGTQTFNGDAQSFYNVTHSGAGTLQLSTYALTTTNSFNNSGGGTFDLAHLAATLGDLQGNGTITSSVVGAITLTVGADNASTTFSGVIQNGTGTVSLTKQGTGVFTLSGSNTYTGTTTISAGTISAVNIVVSGGNSNLGNATSSVVLGSASTSGILNYTGGAATYTRGFTVNAGGGGITNTTASLLTISLVTNQIVNGGLLTLSNTGTGGTTISNVISSTGSINVNNTGTGLTIFSGTNTYSGTTTISSGTLRLGSTTALGTTAGGTTVAGGAVLDLNGITLGTAEGLTLNGTGISGGGALTNNSATASTYSGLISLGSASSIIANSGNIILSAAGTIGGSGFGLELGGTASGCSLASIIGTGAGTVTKSSTGTWTLSGASTYTGLTTISSGTLKIGSAGSGANSPLGTVAGGVSVSAGAALDLNGQTLTTAEPITLNGTGISNAGSLTNSSLTSLSFSGALTLGTASSIGTTGAISLSGGITGGQDLTKVGGQSLSLGIGTASLASLTISAGTFTITSGTLNLTSNFTNNGNFTCGTSTTNLSGASQTIGGTNSTTFYNMNFSGSGTKTLSASTTIGANLSISSGVIADLSTISHSANALFLNGIQQPGGTSISYGGTSSPATYKIPAYFADDTGILTVATGSCTAGNWLGNTSSDWNTASNWCGSAIPGAGTNVTILSGTPFQPVISSSTPAAVCNSITINNGATLTISGSNTLSVNGGWTNNGTFAAGTGTVVFNGAAQTVSGSSVNTFNNVTVSGTGSKTITTANFRVGGILSMEATGTLSAVPTYVGSAALQYNTSTTRTVGSEWITPFVATGGVIIANTGAISMNESKVFSTDVPLTIQNGATLIAGANLLTLGGNFIINSGGIFTSGSGGVTIAGNAATQNIAGFTTTGTVSMTKTGGTATFQGNVNASSLTINGTGGSVLNLGTGLTHTFTGSWTRTGGTLNGGSSLLKIGGSVSGAGGAFNAGTGTVEWNASGNQTIAGVTYNNLTLSGSGQKTTTGATINGILSMEGTATTTGTAATYGGGATLQYKGSSTQTTGIEFPATWSGSGGVKIENATGVTLSGAKNIGTTTLTIGGSIPNSTFNDGGNQLTATGTLNLNSGTLKLGAGTATTFPGFTSTTIAPGTTVEYAATSAQIIKGITYSNLTISGSGSNSKIADGPITVNGILNLSSANYSATQGCLDMNATPFVLTMGAAATTTGTGDVTGIVTRNSFVIDTYYTFGNQFTTLNMQAGGTLPSIVSVKIALSTSHDWKANSINRYYDFSQTGGTSGTKATLSLHYLASELNSNTENNLDLFDYLVSGPTLTDDLRSNSNATDKWVELANLAIDYIAPSTGFGSKYWTLGTSTAANFTWIGGVSADWTNGTNWTGGVAPGPGNSVVIPDALITSFDPELPASTSLGSITIQSGGILNAPAGTPVLTISGGAGAWNNSGTFNPANSTVVFTSAAATMSGTTNFYNLTVNDGATLSPGTNCIMRIAGTISLSSTGILNAIGNHNSIDYNGSDQTVINPNGSTTGYYNLTLSGSGTKTMPSSMMTVSGDLTTSGTASATAGNVLIIAGNVLLGAGTTFDPSTFTHTVSGNWTNNGATFLPTAGTIIFNSTTIDQVINGTALSQTFNNLTVDKTTQTLIFDGSATLLNVNNFTETSGNVTALAALVINGNATFTSGTFTAGTSTTITGNAILSGGTYNAGTTTNLLGNWTNNGTTFMAGSGTLNFNGSSAQTIDGTTSNAFNNLTVNNAAGVTASLDQTINGILYLPVPNASDIKGSLDMGTNTLLMGPNSTTTGTGDVTGYVERTSFNIGTSYTFGNQFTRVSFLSVGTLPTSIKFKISIGTEPSWIPRPADPEHPEIPEIRAIKREYEAVNTGGVNCYANISMHYLDSELNGNTEDKMTKWRWAAGSPETITDMRKSNYNSTDNWIENISVPVSLFPTSPGTVKISMANTIAPTNLWNGSQSSDWTDGFNWTPFGVPNSTSMVDIPDAGTTDNDPILPTDGVTIGTLQILAGGILYSNNQPITLTGMTAAWINNGNFEAGSGTVTFIGNGATIGGTTQFNNLVFDPGAFVTNSNGAIVRIAGSVTNNGVWYTVIGNEATTVEYDGVNQTVVIPDQLTNRYSTLILSGSGTVTMPAEHLDILGDFITGGTVTVNTFQDLAVTGNVTINTGTVFNASTFNHSVGGTWAKNGTFNAGTSTVNFNGTLAAQTMTGSTTFNNLTVSNPLGVSAGANQTVNGILYLPGPNASDIKGSLDMDGFILDLGANATNTGSGDVTGSVRRTASFAPLHTYTFGNQYTSLIFQPGGTTYPTSLLWKISIGAVPGWKADAVKREYEIIRTGSSDCLANITMHYLVSELNGNKENEMVKWQYASSVATEAGRSNFSTSQNWIENDGVSVNSLASSADQIKIGLANSQNPTFTWTGAVNSDWNESGNWSSWPVTATSAVIIPDAGTTANDPILPASGVTILSLTIQNAGILYTNDEPLTIAGNSGAWLNYGAFNEGSGTVTFTGNDATIAGTTQFNDLAISSGAKLTNLQNAWISVTGTVTKTGSWSAGTNPNTVEYNGGAQTLLNPDVAPAGYYNLTLSGNGAKTLPVTTMNIYGDLTLSGLSGTVTTAPTHSLSIGGDLNIGSATAFTAGSQNHSVGGNFINNGTFDGNGSTISFNGSEAQTIGGTIITTFDNLTINSSSTTTLDLTIGVVGNLSITSGVLDIGSFTCDRTTPGGTLSIADGGTLKIGGSNSMPTDYTVHTLGNASTVEYTGTTQTISPESYGNLTASGSSVINGNVTVAGTFLTKTTGNVSIDPPGKVTVSTLTNNGILNLNSTSSEIFSLMVDNYGGTGTSNIQLYLTGGPTPGFNWHYISSPVSNLPVSTFSGVTKNLVQFVEGLPTSDVPNSFQRGWVAYNNYSYFTKLTTGTPDHSFSTLTVGKGYNYYYSVPYTYSFTGTINTAEISPVLTHTGSSDYFSGYNLLGNPYTCGLNWDVIAADPSYPEFTSTAVYFTHNNQSYTYQGGVGVPAETTGHIPPMQGFVVKTGNGFTSGSLLIPLAAREHNNISFSRYKGAGMPISLIRLSVAENDKSSETVVRFDDLAKQGLDYNFDALRMFPSSDVTSIYSSLGGIDYTINGLPFPETIVEIPVAVNLLTNGNHTISTMQLQELDSYNVTLTDKLTNSSINLKTVKDYTFAASAGLVTDRFVLTVGNALTKTENPILTEKLFNIYAGFKMINIQTLSDEWDGKTGTIKVMDFSGRTIIDKPDAEFHKSLLIQFPSPPTSGLYIIEIRSGSMRYVDKIVNK